MLVPTREAIAEVIREGFESPPDDWPENRPWADGALNIADEILRMFVGSESKSISQGLEEMVGEVYDGR